VSPNNDVFPAIGFAHPLTQPYDLPISPAAIAVVAAVFVLVVAMVWPHRLVHPSRSALETASWWDGLSISQRIGRSVAIFLLALAIVSGRIGADDELDNLAPALVVGAGWPLLVALGCTVGPIWRWCDPWDGVARWVARDDDPPPGHVWPAAAAAGAWVWYLSVYPDPLRPRSVGAVLGLYTVVTLAGCLAAGRKRWLASGEPSGILQSWAALLPARRLAAWEAPHGAEVLLGVVSGGVLFGAARRSELWGTLNTVPGAVWWATSGLVLSCAACAGMLFALGRTEHGRNRVARASVPALVGIIVAVALDRNRLFTSFQLLPGLLGDPFGRGWDPFGVAGAGLNPEPLGTTGLSVAQLAVLLAGHCAGAVMLARSTPKPERGPGAVAISVLVGAGVIGLLTH
jgi:hypothetical protein